MEVLAPLWKYAPLVGTILLLVGVALLLARLVRSRPSSAPEAVEATSSPSDVDEELLDSSHIGFAPLVGSLTLPSHQERDAAAGGKGA
jgi:hypothetical protein